MNRSDIMRISALFEIALGSASLIAARFWIGTTNIVGRHVSHGDTKGDNKTIAFSKK